MPELLIEGVPTNLSLPEGSTARRVDSDLYNICERAKEIHDSISIIVLDPPQPKYGAPGRFNNFAIMQHCEDGVDRLMFRAEALDSRVLDIVREAVHVPLAERIAKFDREREANEAQATDDALEELYETMGGQMNIELYKNGFTTTKPSSYRPLNATARRAGRRA